MPKKQNIKWHTILKRIKDGKCTPFLGAGANYEILPESLGGDIAQQLAEKFEYRGKDSHDLIRVAQYLAITEDAMVPKEEILRLLKEQIEQWEKAHTLPDFFKKSNEPLGILAELPFPVYITTNYDDLMIKALKAWKKEPKREFCRWNDLLKKRESAFDPEFVPSVANPLIFHLHGYAEKPQSLVLTEDDYINFLVNISSDEHKLLPPFIHGIMGGTSLLFIGYALTDWNFRVLFRGLVESMEASLRYATVSVQLPQEVEEEKYMVEYFRNIKVDVYWGTAKEFVLELRDRWSEFEDESKKESKNEG